MNYSEHRNKIRKKLKSFQEGEPREVYINFLYRELAVLTNYQQINVLTSTLSNTIKQIERKQPSPLIDNSSIQEIQACIAATRLQIDCYRAYEIKQPTQLQQQDKLDLQLFDLNESEIGRYESYPKINHYLKNSRFKKILDNLRNTTKEFGCFSQEPKEAEEIALRAIIKENEISLKGSQVKYCTSKQIKADINKYHYDPASQDNTLIYVRKIAACTLVLLRSCERYKSNLNKKNESLNKQHETVDRQLRQTAPITQNNRFRN